MLDLDKIGPDWTFATNHGLACRPGKPITPNLSPSSTTSIDNDPPTKHTFCQCCLNVIHKEPISLCENSTKKLQFLGFGFPLYFIFMKYSIILLILQIVTYSALSISWALETSFDICQQGAIRELPNHYEGRCTSWLLKFMRTELDVTRDQVILRFTSFFIHLMGLIYMRDMIRKTNDYYDERTTSLSDYSVLIRNLPNEIGTDKRIREFMKVGMRKDGQGQDKVNEFKVEELVLLNELQDFYKLKDERTAIIKQKQKWMNQKQSQDRTRRLRELDQQHTQKCQQIQKQHTFLRQAIRKDQIKCQKAIIVMQSQDAKNHFLQCFQGLDRQKLVEFFGREGEHIEIDEAPEPKKIIWENINFPQEKRVIRLVIGWVLTALFIAAVTAVFYAILTAKGHAVQEALKKIEEAKHATGEEAAMDQKLAHAEQQKALVATILTMLLIIFFNKFCLSFVLHIFTDIQKHRTGSEYEFSFGLKYTLGLFFTTALMTLLVQDIAFHNIYKQSYGVVQEESMMFFFNAFLVPIIWLVNPWHLLRAFMRWLNQGRMDYTQKQANHLMENPKYSMGKKYAELIESIWFTYLYYSVIPGGAIIILIGLILFYWVDKYTLLRRSSINQNVNGQLSLRAMKLVDATLVLRAAGELIFDSQIRHQITYESIVCLVIGAVYLFLPMGDIIEFFHQQKFRAEEKPYAEVKSKFIENYHTMHPLYTQEKYALISGIDLTTQVFEVSNNFLITETLNEKQPKEYEPKQQRQMREVNDTKIDLVQIKPKEDSFLYLT